MVGVSVYARGVVEVATVDNPVASEFNILLLLQLRKTTVVQQVFQDVLKGTFLAIDFLNLLAFDLLVAALVRQSGGRRGEAGYGYLSQHWRLDIVGAAFEHGHLDRRRSGIDGED